MSLGALSIRTRLMVGAALVLVAFMAVAGVALQRAHADGVRAAHYARLQSTVYLLLAGAELDARVRCIMPTEFAEPRLSLPGSGLYRPGAQCGAGRGMALGIGCGPTRRFRRQCGAVGEWRYDSAGSQRRRIWPPAMACTGRGRARPAGAAGAGGAGGPRQRSTVRREAFQRTLWAGWAGRPCCCCCRRPLLLRWGLAPLRRVAQEITRIESGAQAEVQGVIPPRLPALTGNLNTLIGRSECARRATRRR
jgi:two-component system sensor histidine kinase PhoQ